VLPVFISPLISARFKLPSLKKKKKRLLPKFVKTFCLMLDAEGQFRNIMLSMCKSLLRNIFILKLHGVVLDGLESGGTGVKYQLKHQLF
jgi:hypothetical protein